MLDKAKKGKSILKMLDLKPEDINELLDLAAKLKEMSEEEMIALLATDGMLVKRPIMVTDDAVLVGFREAEWEEIF